MTRIVKGPYGEKVSETGCKLVWGSMISLDRGPRKNRLYSWKGGGGGKVNGNVLKYREKVWCFNRSEGTMGTVENTLEVAGETKKGDVGCAIKRGNYRGVWKKVWTRTKRRVKERKSASPNEEGSEGGGSGKDDRGRRLG